MRFVYIYEAILCMFTPAITLWSRVVLEQLRIAYAVRILFWDPMFITVDSVRQKSVSFTSLLNNSVARSIELRAPKTGKKSAKYK